MVGIIRTGSQMPMVQPQADTVEQLALSNLSDAPPMITDGWKAQLPPDARERIVNKILETLKKHNSFSGQEGLQELKNIASRFEEKIYCAATGQADYLRKISLKLLTMESAKSLGPMAANSVQTSAVNASINTSDLGSNGQFYPITGTVEQSASSSSGTTTAMALDGWRAQVSLDARKRITDKILETLKKHIPFSGYDGFQELKKIAAKLEEKVYTAATSQSDYIRKISLKMINMETKSQSPMANSMQTGAGNATITSSSLWVWPCPVADQENK